MPVSIKFDEFDFLTSIISCIPTGQKHDSIVWYPDLNLLVIFKPILIFAFGNKSIF
jgi:hypothetical protein